MTMRKRVAGTVVRVEWTSGVVQDRGMRFLISVGRGGGGYRGSERRTGCVGALHRESGSLPASVKKFERAHNVNTQFIYSRPFCLFVPTLVSTPFFSLELQPCAHGRARFSSSPRRGGDGGGRVPPWPHERAEDGGQAGQGKQARGMICTVRIP